MSDKVSENSGMSSVAEASKLVRFVAEPCPAGDKVKAAIGRAAQRLNWAYTRTRDIWYGDARRIDAHEIDSLRAIAFEQTRQQAIASLVVLRERMAALDPRDSVERVSALDSALVTLGAEVRTVAVSED